MTTTEPERRGPGRPPIYDWDDLVNQAFGLLGNALDIGLTKDELAGDLGVPDHVAGGLIRRLRLILGDNAVPFRWVGQEARYFLTDEFGEAEPWLRARRKTTLSRIEVEVASWQALVNVTDGRTNEGRNARAWLKHLTRLQEDLVDAEEHDG